VIQRLTKCGIKLSTIWPSHDLTECDTELSTFGCDGLQPYVMQSCQHLALMPQCAARIAGWTKHCSFSVKKLWQALELLKVALTFCTDRVLIETM